MTRYKVTIGQTVYETITVEVESDKPIEIEDDDFNVDAYADEFHDGNEAADWTHHVENRYVAEVEEVA